MHNNNSNNTVTKKTRVYPRFYYIHILYTHQHLKRAKANTRCTVRNFGFIHYYGYVRGHDMRFTFFKSYTYILITHPNCCITKGVQEEKKGRFFSGEKIRECVAMRIMHGCKFLCDCKSYRFVIFFFFFFSSFFALVLRSLLFYWKIVGSECL